MPKKRCRSGCITCRIRRIKCDEGKPSCLRCTSTGRKCDGYEIKIAMAKNPQLKLHQLASRSTISQAPGSLAMDCELRALQHFRRRTAPALSASFDCDFWNTVVLQVSATQDSIRSAIVALSCLHESFEKGHGNIDPTSNVDSNRVLALQQYNKAIHQTAQILDLQDATSCRVALMSCLLFICLELIQDNYTFSINHLVGGLRMLLYCQNAAIRVPSQPSVSLLYDNLKNFFGRIVVQTMFMADTHFDVRVIPKHFKEDMRTSLASVTEARDMLDAIFLSVYPFLHLVKKEPNHGMGKVYQQTLLNRLGAWYSLFRKFEGEGGLKLTAKEITGIRLLEIHYNCLSIMIDTSLDASPCFLDTPAPSFLHVVTLVETLLDQQTKFPSTLDSALLPRLPHYSFDLGVIGPLFYIAVKCWNRVLRQKVISLLQHPNIPHREGIWKASMTVIMAQQIIKVEEEVIRSASTASTKGVEAGASNDTGTFRPDTLKEKVWFDFLRPKNDAKQLKIVVGMKREMPKERREEVITW
ncbi:hypothetical protein N431DRAFT_409358 [Stipitochalara longipes BDJ]|nr:hypothetical protein N431DRAFT_409358 [Stipitochalara longipes BDJ]